MLLVQPALITIIENFRPDRVDKGIHVAATAYRDASLCLGDQAIARLQVFDSGGTAEKHGLAMVTRRAFITPRADESDWLRNNVFQSTCTILGKVCRFIIDGGSCENIISEEVVRKLEIKTSNHLKPYKLACFKRVAKSPYHNGLSFIFPLAKITRIKCGAM